MQGTADIKETTSDTSLTMTVTLLSSDPETAIIVETHSPSNALQPCLIHIDCAYCSQSEGI